MGFQFVRWGDPRNTGDEDNTLGVAVLDPRMPGGWTVLWEDGHILITTADNLIFQGEVGIPKNNSL